MKTETPKASLPHASRIGEEIVLLEYWNVPFEKKVIAIYTVERVTRTLLIASKTDGMNGGRQVRFPFNHPPTSPEQLQIARTVLAGKRQEQRDRQERIAAEQADPKYQLVQRARGGDWEPWDKLTLEQLQTIVGWLDAARGE